MKNYSINIYILLLLLSFVGCGGKTPIRQKSLEQLLMSVSKNEAAIISKDVVEFSQILKRKYDLIPYPNFNNFLINIGVKKRGLCWQLAFDLLEHLKAKKI